MSIIDLLRRDIEDITTNSNDFAESITLHPLVGDTLTINALTTIHHTQFDAESGAIVNSLNGSVAVSEQELIKNYYEYIDDNGEVNFEQHNVEVTEANGTKKTYRIEQFYPDKKLGLIVLILADYRKTL